MRNVIFAINITLDGCCDHTKQFVDEEKLEDFTHLTREVDVQVFGRKTYQLTFPIGLKSSRTSLRQKQIPNLPGHLSPQTKLSFHDR